MPSFAEPEVRRAWTALCDVQKRGYLVPRRSTRTPRHDVQTFERILGTELRGFTVFVTTHCNLACSYCVYRGGYRRHAGLTEGTMSWDTARNMLEFLARHSSQSPALHLEFFGGEPLLAFDLIVRSVQYLQSHPATAGKPLKTTIATNGTILTDGILDFLIRNRTVVQVSLDGEQQVHDRTRPFRDGQRGSFAVALATLERIRERDEGYFRRYVRVKSVITPGNMAADTDAFMSHPAVRLAAETDHLFFIHMEPHYDLDCDGAFLADLESLSKMLRARRAVRSLAELLSPLSARQKAFFDQTFAGFYLVQAYNKACLGTDDEVRFRKGCLPGYNDAAVLPDGMIVVCSKATSFPIGNVDEGCWYLERLAEMEGLLNEAWQDCMGCFLQRFCDLCYAKIADATAWMEARRRFCAFSRRLYYVVFDTMLDVLDQNPELWDDLRREVRERLEAFVAERAAEE